MQQRNDPFTPSLNTAKVALDTFQSVILGSNDQNLQLYNYKPSSATKLAEKNKFYILKQAKNGKASTSTSSIGGVSKSFDLQVDVNGKNYGSVRGTGIAFFGSIALRYFISLIAKNISSPYFPNQPVAWRDIVYGNDGSPRFEEFTEQGLARIFAIGNDVAAFAANAMRSAQDPWPEIERRLGWKKSYYLEGKFPADYINVRVSGKISDIATFVSTTIFQMMYFPQGDVFGHSFSEGRFMDAIRRFFLFTKDNLDPRGYGKPDFPIAAYLYALEYSKFDTKKKSEPKTKNVPDIEDPNMLIFAAADLASCKITTKDGADIVVGSAGKASKDVKKKFTDLYLAIGQTGKINITGYHLDGSIKEIRESSKQGKTHSRKVALDEFRYSYNGTPYIIPAGRIFVANKRTRAANKKQVEVPNSALESTKQFLIDLGLSLDNATILSQNVATKVASQRALGAGKTTIPKSNNFPGIPGLVINTNLQRQSNYGACPTSPTGLQAVGQTANTFFGTQQQTGYYIAQ